MARYHDLHTSTIALIGFLGALLVFAAIVAIQVVVFWTQERFREERVVQVIPGDRAELVAEQRRNLHGSPRWVDPERGIVAVPIDLAQERVVAELAKGEGRFDLPFVEQAAAPNGSAIDDEEPVGNAAGTQVLPELPDEITPQPIPIEDPSDDVP